jgi:hypothetical protein
MVILPLSPPRPGGPSKQNRFNISNLLAVTTTYEQSFHFEGAEVETKIWRPVILSILDQYWDVNSSEHSDLVSESKANRLATQRELFSMTLCSLLRTNGFINRKSDTSPT